MLKVIRVTPGTVIQTPDGRLVTVTDSCAARCGDRMFVTAKIYDGLKALCTDPADD